MRTMQRGIVGMFLIAGSMALAQGPATKLALVNATDEKLVISVYRPGRVDDVSLQPGGNVTAPLNPSKDDRVLVASKAGTGDGVFTSPHKIFATGHFNADQAPGATFVAGVVKDDEGKAHFVYFVRDGDRVKAASTDQAVRRLVEKNEAALTKALAKPGRNTDTPL